MGLNLSASSAWAQYDPPAPASDSATMASSTAACITEGSCNPSATNVDRFKDTRKTARQRMCEIIDCSKDSKKSTSTSKDAQ
jgi:hypothetical protein